jgi:hypothetical protein
MKLQLSDIALANYKCGFHAVWGCALYAPVGKALKAALYKPTKCRCLFMKVHIHPSLLIFAQHAYPSQEAK